MNTVTAALDQSERIQQLEARLDELVSREEIRQCLYRYARAVDRCDLDLLRTVYHPDATDVHSLTYCGNALEFAEFIIPALKQALANRHAITNETIVFDGDRAFVESLWCSTHRVAVDKGDVDVQAEGRYLDVFERRNGEWRIFHRVSVNDKVWTRLVPEPLRASTSAGPEGLQMRVGSKDDPSYLGFRIVDVGVPVNHGQDPLGALRALYASDAPDIDT